MSKAPLIHVICHDIELADNRTPDNTTPIETDTLILMENDSENTPRMLRIPIPDEMKSEFHVAFHYGVKQNKALPSAIELLASHTGQHLRRALLSSDGNNNMRGEILVLSRFTGKTETLEVSPTEAILYAMAHGLPIFARENLLTDSQRRSNFEAEIGTILEGKELLRRIIESGQLPDEFKPEETLVAIANLRRHEIIELIELSEQLEYYEWAYHLSAFVDLDEISPGGMDV